MDENRKSRWIKWGSLILAFVLIVGISAALPRYLTPSPQQPAVKKGKAAQTIVPSVPKTGHIALVNEDQGADFNGQKLDLGNQIVPLFSDQDNYQWETVDRSVADSGLSQGSYQAVFYIPSNFTKNILTFENQKPSTAIISYRADPKLTAADAAKVQTEFEKVRGTLNQQFSKIYWRFISDRINYINGNFAGVLQKEQQYLQAMSDFYKPSSLNMAQIFNTQLDEINQLLAETGQAEKTTAGKQLTLTDTKAQISRQLDALNTFNDQLKKQIQTMDQTRMENEKLVTDASTKTQTSLNDMLAQYQQGVSGLGNQTAGAGDLSLTPELTQLDQLNSYFTDGTQLFNNFQNLGQDNEDQITAVFNGTKTYTQNIYRQIALDTFRQVTNNLAGQILSNGENKLSDAKTALEQTGVSSGSGTGSSAGDSTGAGTGSPTNGSTGNGTGSSAGDSTGTGSPTGGSAGNGTGSSTDNPSNNDQAAYDKVVKAITDLQTEITKNTTYASIPDFSSITATINGIDFSGGTTYSEDNLLNYYKTLSAVADGMDIYVQLNGSDMQSAFDNNTTSDAINTDEKVQNDLTNLNVQYDNAKKLGQALDSNASAVNGTVSGLNTDLGQLNNATGSITGSIKSKDGVIQNFYSVTQQQKADLQTAENVLANNMVNTQQLTADIIKPLQTSNPDISIADTGSGIAVTLQDNNFDQLNMIDQGIQNISDNETLILKDSKDVQSMVNGVQGSAGRLSNSWGQNVTATAELKNAVAQTLGNTGEPGNRNQNVYQQLSSPVGLAGLAAGNVNNVSPGPVQQSAAADSSTPASPVQQPFLTLLAVLIASILTGYFSYHYRSLGKMTNGLITTLLALISSAAIIYYGAVQYGLTGAATIMWSVFTFGLIALMSAWIGEAYRLSEIAGVLLTSALVVFFTLPLLKNSMDDFAFQNPAADVYLSIANSQGYLPFLKGILAIALLTVPVFAVIGTRAIIRHVREEKAHETEIF